MRTFFILLLFAILTSCTKTPNEVESVIKKAGRNRMELKNVIKHYKETGERQKLKAAFFLIANMADKYGVYYSPDSYFLKLLPQVDSLKRDSIDIDKMDRFISKEYKENYLKDTNIAQPQSYLDIHVITSEYLIQNIDLSFKVWKEKTWAKHLNFDEFCEWILPYRIRNEPLQYWRMFMMNELSWVEDSLKSTKSVEEVCLFVNSLIAKDFQFSSKLGFVPMLGGIDAWNNKQGLCDHRYQLITMAMRSIGIPVKIDYTPQLQGSSIGHSWTVLFGSNNKVKSFNGGEEKISLRSNLCIPISKNRVQEGTSFFRNYYATGKNTILKEVNEKDIPPNLGEADVGDVGEEYVGNDNTDLTFTLVNKKNNKYAVLYTFSQSTSLIAISSAKIKNNTVTFKNVGRGNVYVVGYYNKGKVLIEGDPVYPPLKKDNVDTLIVSKTQTQNVRLYRKYPIKPSMFFFRDKLIGAKIQGANTKNFSDSVTLSVITDTIEYKKWIKLHTTKAFRYYRYYSPDTIRIADISLIDKNKKLLTPVTSNKIYGFNSDLDSDDDVLFNNAFDNDIRTNFNAPDSSWVAVDFGCPVQLLAFSVMPRNHLNIIEPGDTYELLYYDKKWYSLGSKVAEDSFIDFENVPLDALLLLRNLSRGKEERIFRYINDKQVWL